MQSPTAAPSAAPSGEAPAAAVSGAEPGAEGSAKAGPLGGEAAVGGAFEATPPSSPSSASSAKPTMLPEDCVAGSSCGGSGCVFLRRVRGLPAVQALLGAYAGAKAYPVVGWALSVGEKSALLATEVCRPVAFVYGVPLACADWCLCKALDVADGVIPCVSMTANKVCGRTKDYVADCIFCPPRAAAQCWAKVCPACSQSN